jgi:hypothetical protein
LRPHGTPSRSGRAGTLACEWWFWALGLQQVLHGGWAVLERVACNWDILHAVACDAIAVCTQHARTPQQHARATNSPNRTRTPPPPHNSDGNGLGRSANRLLTYEEEMALARLIDWGRSSAPQPARGGERGGAAGALIPQTPRVLSERAQQVLFNYNKG